MQLPESLRRAIEREAEGLKLSSLAKSAEQLSASYRQFSSSAMASDLDRTAYLVSRMPATYAATRAVLMDIRERLPKLHIESVLDLGAGPGTASWAAVDVFPDARKITLIEKDSSLVQLGKRLTETSEHPAWPSAAWQVADVTSLPSMEAHDLVLLSYVAGELDARQLLSSLQLAWNATQSVLAIVEPGTPAAFSRVRLLRDALLENGAHIVSPCPHELACPMSGDDWCHFAQRVERSSLHRRLKGGTLGYEDEKYSYIAVSRIAAPLPAARIIRHPAHHSGFVELSLCAGSGLRKEAVTRKQREAFRRARKASWGGAWESRARTNTPSTNT